MEADGSNATVEEMKEMDRLEKLIAGDKKLSAEEERELSAMFAGEDLAELERELEAYLSDEEAQLPACFVNTDGGPSNYDEEWLFDRDLTKEETDKETLLKGGSIPFPEHNPDTWASQEYKEALANKNMVTRLLQMRTPPHLKAPENDEVGDSQEEKIIRRGQNQLRLEGLEGIRAEDDSSSSRSPGRGRGRGKSVEMNADTAAASSFGSLGEGANDANAYKDLPASFFEDASEEANASILRLLHDVHIDKGVDAVAEGIREAQVALRPVRPNVTEDHPHFEKVMAMCETLEKNAHLDHEYKAELVRMYEEELEAPEEELNEFGQKEYSGVMPTPRTDAKGYLGPERTSDGGKK